MVKPLEMLGHLIEVRQMEYIKCWAHGWNVHANTELQRKYRWMENENVIAGMFDGARAFNRNINSWDVGEFVWIECLEAHGFLINP